MILEQKKLVDNVRRFVSEGEKKRLKTLDKIRVEGRYADGTLALRSLIRGECVYRGNVAPGYEGQIVETEPGPPLNISGAAGVSVMSLGRVGATLMVETLEPHFYRAGVSYTAVGTGWGFLPTFSMEFGKPGTTTGELDEYTTITEIRVLSDTEFEVDLTRAADAPPVDAETAPIFYDNVGAPP